MQRRIRLTIVPCSFRNACDFIRALHRHHKPPIGHIFSIAVVDDNGTVRGVATIGRPVARNLDDGLSLEVNRVATDGCFNACSALLAGARRVGFAMGYRRIFTYTLPAEGGASLRGAGWTFDGKKGGGKWATPGYAHIKRADVHPLGVKHRWRSENQNAAIVRPTWPTIIDDPTQTRLFFSTDDGL